MILGLDIGGANIKLAYSHGVARSMPFALWKEPGRLPHVLRELLDEVDTNPSLALRVGMDFPSTPTRSASEHWQVCSTLAVTMTGELCDCFASRGEGVRSILSAVEQAADGRTIRVWTNEGRFVSAEQARQQPLQAAAANWLALAHAAAKMIGPEPGLLIDIGSTTTDIIPLMDGKPRPKGLTDVERLRSRELVYCGVRRTPLCAVLGLAAAAEFFATTLDVFLVLGMVAEDAGDLGTADGRPATRAAAHARLAHMLCGDGPTVRPDQTRNLAELALKLQVDRLAGAVHHVAKGMKDWPRILVLAGSGEFLAEHVLAILALRKPDRAESATRWSANCGRSVVSLAQRFGPAVSAAACAHAVAQLAEADRHG